MQTVSDLTVEMIKYIEAKRDWVRNHYTIETISEYDSVAGKLKLLDTIIKSNWINKHESYKLQSLGITLGDILVQDMNFVWVEVKDQYGTDPALQLPDTTLILFPLTMISKRIETGKDVDIYELYDGLKEKVKEIKHEAQ
ncbi:MAG: hypothetical protein JWQ27_1118 [Ferruginibacter sp.]|nr:hypothetical protein [Ferruginibacter sp.]